MDLEAIRIAQVRLAEKMVCENLKKLGLTKEGKKMTIFNRLLKEFEDATRADTWKGGGHPDDRESIEDTFKEAERNITDYVNELGRKANE